MFVTTLRSLPTALSPWKPLDVSDPSNASLSTIRLFTFIFIGHSVFRFPSLPTPFSRPFPRGSLSPVYRGGWIDTSRSKGRVGCDLLRPRADPAAYGRVFLETLNTEEVGYVGSRTAARSGPLCFLVICIIDTCIRLHDPWECVCVLRKGRLYPRRTRGPCVPLV